MSSAPVALVTGCAKPDGMGAAIARRLAAEGRAVVVTDRSSGGIPNDGDVAAERPEDSLGELAAEIAAAGGSAASLLCDIGDEASVANTLEEVDRRFGRLDILVNNAAAPQGADRADILDVPLDAWETQLRVNLTGSFLMVRGAVALMRPRRYGRIVNISSMAALEAAGRSTAYSASKAGVLGLTRSLAMDVAGWGITVNAVCPGLVATSRSMLGRRGEDRHAAMRARGERIAVGRVGTTGDIAHVVAFLAHEDSGYLTGQAIAVDGGGMSPYTVGRPDVPQS
ncbi:SDR family NAD(P)-dependent oxidoreductase [Microbacterium lushaniae]|uniref:SDR family oxidoreductase n=1 Tax=Microbacterium lushaniae TaxID=2614639 RepID=A0A5J6L4A8_9MICO|nr:SDR family NAD(P)-dependent oxidoreductase [Microbacterium lushaniae]QEW03206.1 SDR family oxidoreductase [Microbacterium lushaniae]